MALERSKAELKIVGPETVGNTVPADVLVRTIEGLQRLVLMAVAAQDGRDLKKRFKPSRELRRQHALRFGIPTAGSYTLAVTEVDETGQMQLGPERPGLALVVDLAGAVRAEDQERARKIVPKDGYRHHMLRAMQELAPSEGDRWAVDLAIADGQQFRFDYSVRREVERLLRKEQPSIEDGSVIGSVERIDFVDQKVTVRQPVSLVQVQCTYPPEYEEVLCDERREMIQLVGRVSRNADGAVVSISDVTMVASVDETPFELERFESHGRTIRLDPPLVVTPELDDDTQQVFVFSDDELDLHVAAHTRGDLHDEIAASLAFAWDEYGRAADDDLTPAARALKSRLLARMTEEHGAAP
jgi:hypothetical protein